MQYCFIWVGVCCLCFLRMNTIVGDGEVFQRTGPSDRAAHGGIRTAASGKDGDGVLAALSSVHESERGPGGAAAVTAGALSRASYCRAKSLRAVTAGDGERSGKIPGQPGQVRSPLPPPFTTLVWSDEFSVDGAPDSTKWAYETGTGDNGWGNAEQEYYTSRPDNAVVKDGCLIITAKKENYLGSSYTSARIVSKKKFTYCKVDIRAKLPATAGTWPALWMLGNDVEQVGWPACGEIDIAEQHASELNTIYATLHYPGLSSSGLGATTKLAEPSSGFHRYTLEWTAATITVSIDDHPIFSTDNKKELSFHHDFFFILNVAMGGGFGGDISPSFKSDSMTVDYIRVYE